jgi:hypothetical protein
MRTLNIVYYKLAKNVSRISRNGGGSCIWVWKDLNIREVSYLRSLGSENDFEMTYMQLIDVNLIVVCIYRSPHSDCHVFLNKLEKVIDKVWMKGMKLILCGDWNINFLQDSIQLSALQSLLGIYNLVNTVTSP